MTWSATGRTWALLLAVSASGAAAQSEPPLADSSAWVRIGTTWQRAKSFAFSGSHDDPVIWVGSRSSLWRLEGDEWVEMRNATEETILLFNTEEAVPDTIVTGGSQRSVDGGLTWRQGTWADTGELFYGGPGLAEAPPGSPWAGRIFAGDSFGGNGQFGYSTDRARTWHAPATQTVMKISDVVALRSGRVVTAGFIGAALSDDGGVTFRPVPDLYQDGLVRYDHQALVVLPGFTPQAAEGGSTEGRLVVVGGERGRTGLRVRVSDDEGDSWREASSVPADGSGLADLAAVPESVGGGPGWAVLADNDGIIWGTVDGGETWAEIGVVPESGFFPTASDPYNDVIGLAVGPDGRLYAGSAFRWSWRTVGRVGDALRSAFAVAGEDGPGATDALGVRVWPNPTGGAATVVLALGAPEAVTVRVYDAQGREVAVVHDGAASDGQRFAVETAGLAPGAYVVRATTASGARASAGLTVVR